MSVEAIIDCPALQNPFVCSKLSVDNVRKGSNAKFKVGPRRPDLVDWILEAKQVFFAALKKAGTVYIEWAACRITEYCSVTRVHVYTIIIV